MSKSTGDTDIIETDTVEAWAAGEFSEDTLNIVRGYEKPDWLEEPSSLDPLEDLEEHVLNNLRLPPRTYDAMKEAVAEEAAELRAAKAWEPDPRHKSLVELRHRLAKGTSLDEIKLLKLRAYYRGVEARREEEKVEQESRQRALMQQYEVPLDAVPEELIGLTPEQMGVRWLRANRARAGKDQKPLEDSGFEDSEWIPGWDCAQSYLSSADARQEILASIIPLATNKVSRIDEVEDRTWDKTLAASPEEMMVYGDPSRYKEWRPHCEYATGYIRQQELQKKARAQRLQRSVAFWLPLCAALGASLLRRLKRQKSGRKKSSEVS